MPVLTDRTTQLARAACAAHFDELGAHHTANRFREGKLDDMALIDIARRAVELAGVSVAAEIAASAPTAIERELRHIELYGCGSEARPKIADGPHEVQALLESVVDPAYDAPAIRTRGSE